jgi:hypothetical protein
LTKNEIQIGGEAIENLFVNMVLRKKKLKLKSYKDTIPCLFTWEWAK